MSLNKVMLIGRLGADPDTTQTKNGKQVTKFRLATDSGWGDNKTTDWHTVVTFDKTAEVCSRYLAKGRQVHIEGRISYRKYESEEGTKWYTDIIANNVTFLGGDEAGSNQSRSNNNSNQSRGNSYSNQGSRGGGRGRSGGNSGDGFADYGDEVPF